MSSQPSTNTSAEPKARNLESKLTELEELLMDLRAELRFIGCSETHPLTLRLVKLIDDIKQR